MDKVLSFGLVIASVFGTVSAIKGISDMGTRFPSEPVTECVKSSEGRFYNCMEFENVETDKKTEEKYYQFESDDGEVQWVLTEGEIGFVPNADDKYVLYYSDNGDTGDIYGVFVRIERDVK